MRFRVNSRYSRADLNFRSRYPPITRIDALNRDWRFDRGMRVVTDEFEIFELEVVNVFDSPIQFHSRQRPAIACKLFARLLQMIVVEMQIAKRVDEIARRKINRLGDHHREERVACDVERHTKEKITAALVKLAA